jgi:hypothetical protein
VAMMAKPRASGLLNPIIATGLVMGLKAESIRCGQCPVEACSVCDHTPGGIALWIPVNQRNGHALPPGKLHQGNARAGLTCPVLTCCTGDRLSHIPLLLSLWLPVTLPGVLCARPACTYRAVWWVYKTIYLC